MGLPKVAVFFLLALPLLAGCASSSNGAALVRIEVSPASACYSVTLIRGGANPNSSEGCGWQNMTRDPDEFETIELRVTPTEPGTKVCAVIVGSDPENVSRSCSSVEGQAAVATWP